jgi:hypothetical protein
VRSKIGSDGSGLGKIRLGEFLREEKCGDGARRSGHALRRDTTAILREARCFGFFAPVAESGANGGHDLSGCCEVEVAGGPDRRGWEFFVFGQAVFDFVADGDTEVGVGFLLPFPVADTAVKEIGAVADVALVFVRPFDEAEVTVCGFHVGNLVFWFGFGNDFGDLALLLGFGIVAFRSG